MIPGSEIPGEKVEAGEDWTAVVRSAARMRKRAVFCRARIGVEERIDGRKFCIQSCFGGRFFEVRYVDRVVLRSVFVVVFEAAVAEGWRWAAMVVEDHGHCVMKEFSKV